MTVVFAAVEVAAYAVLEHFRLADVNDFPLGVFHDINAGAVGQLREPSLYMFIDLGFHCKSSRGNIIKVDNCMIVQECAGKNVGDQKSWIIIANK